MEEISRLSSKYLVLIAEKKNDNLFQEKNYSFPFKEGNTRVFFDEIRSTYSEKRTKNVHKERSMTKKNFN